MISTTKNPDKLTNGKTMETDYHYIGILSYVLKTDLPLALKTSEAKFSRKSFIEYTKKYHDDICDSGEKCIIFENDYKKKFTKFDFTAFGGFEMNEMYINYDHLSKMLSSSPVVGVGLNISSPRIMKTLNLIMDATLSEIAGGCDFFANYRVYYQYKFSGIKSNFGVGLEYIYNKGKIRPAVNVGLSANKYLNITTTLKSYSGISDNTLKPEQSSSGFKTGFGFDYQIKNNKFIVIRLLYSKNKNIYDANNFYQLKLGYKY